MDKNGEHWRRRGGLLDMAGHLDRPIAAGSYLIPAKVRLDGESRSVVWKDQRSEVLRDPAGTVQLLGRFVRLSRQPPASILAFVREWGPLDLRRSLRRFLRQYSLTDEQLEQFARSLLNEELPDGLGCERTLETIQNGDARVALMEFGEPISVYRAFAGYIQSILNMTADIYAGNRTERDWLTKYPYHCETCPFGFDAARHEVEHALAQLLSLGEFSYALSWKPDGPDGGRWCAEVCFPGLLGAIAAKLMMVVTKSDGLYTCYGCGKAYLRSAELASRSDGQMNFRARRRPKPGERNYCLDCGVPRAQLEAKRRLRARMNEAHSLREQGLSAREIAARIGSKIETVKKWLRKG